MERDLLHKEQLLEYRPRNAVSFLINGVLISLPLQDIIRVKSWVAGTIIFTESKSYRCYLTIDELERTLPINQFFKVNPHHILALQRISGWKEKAALVGSRHFYLSKAKRMALNFKLGQILDTNYDWFYEKGV